MTQNQQPTATPPNSTSVVTTQSGGNVSGTTEIAESVVSRLAGAATREIKGVHEMHDFGANGLTRAFGGITGRDQTDKGVAVTITDQSCTVNLDITVDQDANIPTVTNQIRRAVSGRIKAVTGLDATEINIMVADIYVPQQ